MPGQTTQIIRFRRGPFKTRSVHIRSICASDFLHYENGCPLSVFIVERPKDMFNKIISEIEKDKPTEQKHSKGILDMIEKVLQAGVVTYPGRTPFDSKKYLAEETSTQECFLLFDHIISISVKVFTSLVRMDNMETNYWDLMAKRYGKLPIECLIPSGDYTDLDAYLFNSHVLSSGVDQDVKVQKKRTAEIQRKTKGRKR